MTLNFSSFRSQLHKVSIVKILLLSENNLCVMNERFSALCVVLQNITHKNC